MIFSGSSSYVRMNRNKLSSFQLKLKLSSLFYNKIIIFTSYMSMRNDEKCKCVWGQDKGWSKMIT